MTLKQAVIFLAVFELGHMFITLGLLIDYWHRQ